jgi:hypothetical protein
MVITCSRQHPSLQGTEISPLGLAALGDPVFRKWFEVRFYPLIQDLVGEELSATEVDEEFISELRTALEGLEQHT